MRKKNESYFSKKNKTDTRVKYCIKDNIPMIKETISPAPKRETENVKEIESLYEAMKYYEPYVDMVQITKKYMGSYCLMVLNKDHEKSYFVSRNGYKLDYIEGLHEASQQIQSNVFVDERKDAEWVLVESELMPWRLLGEGLIEQQYENYNFLHKHHHDILRDTGIMSKVLNIRKNRPWEKDNLKSHEERQYQSIRDIDFPVLDDYKDAIELHKKQVDFFGKEAPTEFKPFDILCYHQDGEVIFNDDKSKILDIIDPSHVIHIKVDDYKRAYDFFDSCKSDNEEGIVVKPIKSRLINIAPSFKVRTKEYLHMIYGVNFMDNFDYYFNKRNVHWKMNQSIKQYEYNLQMLNIPFHEITENNNMYKDLLYKNFNAEFVNENKLDTRL